MSIPKQHNLVLNMPMILNQSGAVQDFSSYGNHGTNYGSSVTETPFGMALDFDGSNDYIDCGTDSSLYPSLAITMSAWIKRNATGTAHEVIRNKNPVTGFVYRIRIESNDKLMTRFVFSDATDTGELEFGNVGTNWTMVSITFSSSSGEIKHYIDGALTQTTSGYTGKTLQSSSNGIFIGGNSQFFDGSITQVFIYDTTLTASEITELYDYGQRLLARR